MAVEGTRKPRRTFRWSKEARDLVKSNLNAQGSEVSELIVSLVSLSGNPSDACRRFARQLGLQSKRRHQEWTGSERQRLLRLISRHSVREVAALMRRSEFSIYQALLRLGAGSAARKDGFTKYSLAKLLHVRPEEIERWIDNGWLAARVEGTERMPRTFIAADDFAAFCKRHKKAVVGNRINQERMEFIRFIACPPSHAELLPVRDAKKEQAAYDAQMNGTDGEEQDSDFEDFEEEGDLSLPAQEESVHAT
jgi:hypothetical protein